MIPYFTFINKILFSFLITNVFLFFCSPSFLLYYLILIGIKYKETCWNCNIILYPKSLRTKYFIIFIKKIQEGFWTCSNMISPSAISSIILTSTAQKHQPKHHQSDRVLSGHPSASCCALGVVELLNGNGPVTSEERRLRA